eukprot:Sro1910_g304860.2  (404) ;mRNA; r:2239-3450
MPVAELPATERPIGHPSSTIDPSPPPTGLPSPVPADLTNEPTEAPSTGSTSGPATDPSPPSTRFPTPVPTDLTNEPTRVPSTGSTSGMPSLDPSIQPTQLPTDGPVTESPSEFPTAYPTMVRFAALTRFPTNEPQPENESKKQPEFKVAEGSPTSDPTLPPTDSPSVYPTIFSTRFPTVSPISPDPTTIPTSADHGAESPEFSESEEKPITTAPTTVPTEEPTATRISPSTYLPQYFMYDAKKGSWVSNKHAEESPPTQIPTALSALPSQTPVDALTQSPTPDLVTVAPTTIPKEEPSAMPSSSVNLPQSFMYDAETGTWVIKKQADEIPAVDLAPPGVDKPSTPSVASAESPTPETTAAGPTTGSTRAPLTPNPYSIPPSTHLPYHLWNTYDSSTSAPNRFG